MARKKKKTTDEVGMTGEALYEQTKYSWRLYLVAALAAGHRQGIDPMEQLKEFRKMAQDQAVRELMGEKPHA